MPLNWIDVADLSFNTLLLLERVQLSWFPDWGGALQDALPIALRANPTVRWYLQHKCPEIAGWVDDILRRAPDREPSPDEVRTAERQVLAAINDLVVYAVDPAIYDAQPFHGWDSRELTDMTDWVGKRVIDVGSGTGRQAFTLAREGATVFCIEPVENLRRFMREHAREQGLADVYPVDGLITEIPFPAAFADVKTSGHSFGGAPADEIAELLRVTKPGGMVILCPGNNDKDNEAHAVLLDAGFQWSRLEEPRDGWKRKYWRVV